MVCPPPQLRVTTAFQSKPPHNTRCTLPWLFPGSRNRPRWQSIKIVLSFNSAGPTHTLISVMLIFYTEEP